MTDKPKDLTPTGIIDFIRAKVGEETRRNMFAGKWTAEQRARAEAAQGMVDATLAALVPREQVVIEHDPAGGCGGCPVLDTDGRPVCNAEDRVLDEEHVYGRARGAVCDDVPAPDWCPLRDRDVLVRRPR